jgi:hypothetical protein
MSENTLESARFGCMKIVSRYPLEADITTLLSADDGTIFGNVRWRRVASHKTNDTLLPKIIDGTRQ